jgi:hypothetical protein
MPSDIGNKDMPRVILQLFEETGYDGESKAFFNGHGSMNLRIKLSY